MGLARPTDVLQRICYLLSAICYSEAIDSSWLLRKICFRIHLHQPSPGGFNELGVGE
jgi:hypothetical protein